MILELTYLQGIIQEFNKQHVEFYLHEFDGNHIVYEFCNGDRSVKYSKWIDNVDPHGFRVDLLRELDEFFDW
jgi:hypothetical protein